MDNEIIDKKPKGIYPSEIKKLFNLLKFSDRLPDVMGSSSLISQKYFGDYDLFSYIGFPSMDLVYNRMSQILESIIQSKEYYFIEFKIQGTNGKKFRWFYNETFLKNQFFDIVSDVKIDFMKIDLIAYIDYKFIEVSSIYKLDLQPVDMIDENKHNKEQLISIREDLIELKKEKKYFKILKRIYSIAKINSDSKLMNDLTKFFNSDVGEMYSDYSNIEAINRLLEQKNINPEISGSVFSKRLKENFKVLSKNSGRTIRNISELNALSKDLFKEINLKAEAKIKELNLKI